MKPGDSIICINSQDGYDGYENDFYGKETLAITMDKVYTITNVIDSERVTGIIMISDDDGDLIWINTKRFIPLREYNLKKLKV